MNKNSSRGCYLKKERKEEKEDEVRVSYMLLVQVCY